MEREGSLPYSQKPASVPYPEPDVSSPRTPSHPISLRHILIWLSHLSPSLPSSLPFQIFQPKFLTCPMRATYLAHLIQSEVRCIVISS
jgi:hypothetical protein